MATISAEQVNGDAVLWQTTFHLDVERHRRAWRAVRSKAPIARDAFDIHRRGAELVYVRERCAERDVAPRFFLHVLAGAVHSNLDFDFRQRGVLTDGRCVARRFLDEVVEALPATLRSIQVDGGSEFMAEFEDACRKLGVELHVLPPRRPQWNGCVERANRTARIEFWNFLDCELTVQAVSAKLLLYEFFYNYERPHSSLDYLTPNEYLVAQEAA